jgi:hypothetical protein
VSTSSIAIAEESKQFRSVHLCFPLIGPTCSHVLLRSAGQVGGREIKFCGCSVRHQLHLGNSHLQLIPVVLSRPCLTSSTNAHDFQDHHHAVSPRIFTVTVLRMLFLSMAVCLLFCEVGLVNVSTSGHPSTISQVVFLPSFLFHFFSSLLVF